MKRLEMAFAALRANGFLVSEGRKANADTTASILKDAMKGSNSRGYVLYTSQDEKAFLAGVPLRLYFGSNGKHKVDTRKIVYGFLASAGFEVENG